MLDDSSGTTIAGRYQIVGLIGKGGLGVVYRAVDLHLGKTIALKVLPKGIGDGQEHQTLIAEAKILERLHCPNIVCIYDYGEAGNSTYLATEYVEGHSLAEILRRGKPIDILCAAVILRQIGKALECIHQSGLIHRDIKPSNILISKQGKVLLIDFGLAGQPGPQLTGIGTIVGTPAYMSPEQATGEAIDARSDVFSLAAVIYESVTGRRPFEGHSIGDLLRKVAETRPVSPRELNPLVNRGLEAALLKALANDPAQRFSSVQLFMREVDRSMPRFVGGGDDASILLRRLLNRTAASDEPIAEEESDSTFASFLGESRTHAYDGELYGGDSATLAGRTDVSLKLQQRKRRARRWRAAALVLFFVLVLASSTVTMHRQAVGPAHAISKDYLLLLVIPLAAALIWLGRFISDRFGRRGAVELAREKPQMPADELGAPPTAPVVNVDRVAECPVVGQINPGQEITPREFSDELPTIETIPHATEIFGGLAQLKSGTTAVAWLLFLNGPLRGRQVRLSDTFTINSAAVDDVVLQDPSVSRRHAQIVLENGRFCIYDLESRRGTLVNGVPIQRQELQDRDEVRIGNVSMLFVNAVSQEDLTEEARRRLSEFHSLWEELKRSVHHD